MSASTGRATVWAGVATVFLGATALGAGLGPGPGTGPTPDPDLDFPPWWTVPADMCPVMAPATWGGDFVLGGVDGPVYELEASDHGLYVGGQFTAAGGVTARSIARLDGAGWHALASDGPCTEGPDFPADPGIGLTFENGSPGRVDAIEVIREDIVYAGGLFDRAAGVKVYNIAMWAFQDVWCPFHADLVPFAGGPPGYGFNAHVRTFVRKDQGTFDKRVLVGGDFTSEAPQPEGGTPYYFAYASYPHPHGFSNVGTDGPVHALALHGGGVFLGGEFTQAFHGPSQAAATNIVRWDEDGEQMAVLGAGVDQRVSALASWQGALVAGGSFENADGSPVRRLGRWQGTSWSELGGGADAQVNVLHVSTIDSALYAGGYFSEVGQTPALAARGIARFDGADWDDLLGGVGPSERDTAVHAIETYDDGSGSCLYVGGRFSHAGGGPASNLARLCCKEIVFDLPICCVEPPFQNIYFQVLLAGKRIRVTDNRDGIPELLQCEGEELRPEPGSRHQLCGLEVLVGTTGDDRLSARDSPRPTLIFGGTGDDELTGSPHADLIFGAGGNDVLTGLGGESQLMGGLGDDALVGGGDDDALIGGPGLDRLEGGPGRDLLSGGDGHDEALADEADEARDVEVVLAAPVPSNGGKVLVVLLLALVLILIWRRLRR